MQQPPTWRATLLLVVVGGVFAHDRHHFRPPISLLTLKRALRSSTGELFGDDEQLFQAAVARARDAARALDDDEDGGDSATPWLACGPLRRGGARALGAFRRRLGAAAARPVYTCRVSDDVCFLLTATHGAASELADALDDFALAPLPPSARYAPGGAAWSAGADDDAAAADGDAGASAEMTAIPSAPRRAVSAWRDAPELRVIIAPGGGENGGERARELAAAWARALSDAVPATPPPAGAKTDNDNDLDGGATTTTAARCAARLGALPLRGVRSGDGGAVIVGAAPTAPRAADGRGGSSVAALPPACRAALLEFLAERPATLYVEVRSTNMT